MLTIGSPFLLALLVTTIVSAHWQVVHYPPKSSNINNLDFVLNGFGAPGIFNSSVTPEREQGIHNRNEVVHYPPTSSNFNNLTLALNGSGTPGIFNSSVTPEKAYGIYNWCNMPHVRAQEYKCVNI